MRTRDTTHKQIAAWLPHEQLAQLDAHLAREAARVPGSKLSRASWLTELVRRELDAARPLLVCPGERPASPYMGADAMEALRAVAGAEGQP